MIFADKESHLTISGGTDVAWSPSIDYFTHVILPEFQRFSEIEVLLKRRGYYPKGGGKVELRVKPRYRISSYRGYETFKESLVSQNAGLDITSRGSLVKIGGISHAGKDLERAGVSLMQAKAAGSELEGLGVPIDISSMYVDSESVGSGITLWALFESKERSGRRLMLGADALGERGKRAEARKKCVAGANILAVVKTVGGRMKVDPSTDVAIDMNDVLIAIGTREELRQLEGLT